MIDDRTKMLAETVLKLHRRGARRNVQRILAKTHKADVAAMMAGMDIGDRLEIFHLEPSMERRAEILSYLDKEHQKEMLEALSKEEVLTLVSLMDTDDAADLLGHLPEEEAKQILSSMLREDSEEVADLMGYPDDSAGGLMSSEYLALKQQLTVEEAIRAIQNDEDESRVLFYIYVVNDNDQLTGVLSLKELLLSRKNERLQDLMNTDVVSVNLDTSAEQVAKIVERYDFLSLPVVDSSNKLVGVITVDDVLDVIREEAEEDLLAMGQAGWDLEMSTFGHFKARLPWLMMAFLGGSVCFSIVLAFSAFDKTGNGFSLIWMIAAFIPMLLSLGGTTGSQAATVAVSAVRAGHLNMGRAGRYILNELKLSLLFALLFGLLIFGLSEAIFSEYNLSLVVAGAMALQIVIAMILGCLIPLAINKIGAEPTFASIPFFTAVADVTAIAVLFGLLNAIS